MNRRTKAELHHEKELIINFVDAQGEVTVRQVYYFLVSNNIVPNSKSSYKMVDTKINELRYKQLISFDSIIDSTNFNGTRQWDSVKDMLDHARENYRSNWNRKFDVYVEVWIEKEALSAIASRVANRFGIHTSVSQGIPKISQVYSFLQRVVHYNKPTVILYFGDWDPTGLHIDQVIRDQINKQTSTELPFFKNVPEITIKRIAITEEQTRNLPENFQKANQNDPNFKEYVAKYGTKTWELDALSSRELEDIATKAIQECRPISRIKELIKRDEEEVMVLATN
jgi:hypothetical protein